MIIIVEHYKQYLLQNMLNIVEHIKKTGERPKAFTREEIKKTLSPCKTSIKINNS